MTRVMVLCFVMSSVVAGSAQSPARGQGGAGRGGPAAAPTPSGPQEMLLWENGAPGALGQADTDKPTLTAYFAPRGSSGTAVIVAPGGGYGNLAMEHEGRQEAYWFNAMGVTAFVLKYRLGPRYHHPVELGDAQRAIRIVRSRASEFNVLPDRIGMMGFSAGGHLTSTAGTHFDAGNAGAPDVVERASSRPDFLILGYPVISFDPAVAHAGSVRNLLGDSPDPKLIEDLSNDLRVTAQTPPTFLFHTSNDPGVPVENSVRFYLALRKAKVPAEMHLFENGPHGVGMALADPALSSWTTLLMNWMRGRGLLTRPGTSATAR
jgi:acetyl esterase/lipase